LECGTEVPVEWSGLNEGIKSCHQVTCIGADGVSELITYRGPMWELWDPACQDATQCPATPITSTTTTTTTAITTCELECGTEVPVEWSGLNEGIKSCHQVTCIGANGVSELITYRGTLLEVWDPACPDATQCPVTPITSTTTTTTTAITTCKLECGTEVPVEWSGLNEGIKSCHKVTCIGADGVSELITYRGPMWELWNPACQDATQCPATPITSTSTTAETVTTTTTAIMTCKLECGTEVPVEWSGLNEGIKLCHKVACIGANGVSELITHRGPFWEVWDPACPDATCAAMATKGISTASFVQAANGKCVKPNKVSCRQEACKAVGLDGRLKSCGCRKKSKKCEA